MIPENIVIGEWYRIKSSDIPGNKRPIITYIKIMNLKITNNEHKIYKIWGDIIQEYGNGADYKIYSFIYVPLDMLVKMNIEHMREILYGGWLDEYILEKLL